MKKFDLITSCIDLVYRELEICRERYGMALKVLATTHAAVKNSPEIRSLLENKRLEVLAARDAEIKEIGDVIVSLQDMRSDE